MANAAPAPVAFGQKMRFCTSAIAPHTYPACSISLNGVNNVFAGPNSRHNIPEPYTAQASAGSALRIICSPSASSGRKPRPRGRLSTLCNLSLCFSPLGCPRRALSAVSAPSILDQLRSRAAFCARLSPQTCHTPFHFQCVFSCTLPGP